MMALADWIAWLMGRTAMWLENHNHNATLPSA
jgi:hypothetical protein